MNLHAEEIGADGGEIPFFGVNHRDAYGNVWSVCECGHASKDEALACAATMLDRSGRIAFESYNDAVGGVTWDGKPIPGWDAVTEKVREGWRTAAFAARQGAKL